MLKRIFQFMRCKFSSYICQQGGIAAIVFALFIPVIAVSAGIAVDLATAYNAKNRLGNALDNALLATASSTGTPAQLQTIMQNFFNANYPVGKYGVPFNVTLTVNGLTMTATASTQVPTTFMSLFGENYINVSGQSQVVRQLTGIEAVLVLDITGSMAGNNIAALKTAATNFLNVMFTQIANISDIKIGIVPWNDAVNVGSYGQGLTPTGAYYGPTFVNPPAVDPYGVPSANIHYGTGTYDWGGCVIENTPVTPLMDNPPPPNWQMYRYPSGNCTAYNCTSYQCATYNCLAYNCTQYNCTKYKANGTCKTYGTTCLAYGNTCVSYGNTCVTYSNTCLTHGHTCVQWQNTPNLNCSPVPVQPMTNNQATLQAVINSLPTLGNTYSDIGMVWGWRLISPGAPFSEGASYSDPTWSKTVILMTDGNNTINGVYSGEGPWGAQGSSQTPTDQDNNFEQVCTNMKALGIRIYTITFQSAINETTKSYYLNCATTSSMYFDAPTNADLLAAFNSIATQLSTLHVAQ